eukprot:gnl/MRDRNA2_/MRDRNA2_107772_c0_seq1.p1 gnl/MRDRNA2_/MRDRNA2_107772_c0~~gnl/MRDRNA2_/MRDRNA2_107772_c0_seq1.p1  ORF type:complete len:906 (+),score=138.75 gnl/MRDRNA2_/MRDRNA2_107772_c0_seq1:200-2917(+)
MRQFMRKKVSALMLGSAPLWVFAFSCVFLPAECSVESAESAGSSTAEEGSSSEEHVHPHVALLFPFVSIMFGCMVMHAASRIPAVAVLPYTVTLFMLGIFMGILHVETHGGLLTLSHSIDMWIAIDPHLLLYAFLPALLFGDSMGINWHDFERCAAQCALLAGPGVIMGTGLMYLVAKFIFPYDWDDNRAAAFASILAATDPVAVVGLLKEMGASRTLTMQIAGESLLNDGMAIVVWLVFYNMMNGQEYTAGDVALLFLQLALGGLVFGLVLGIVSLKWISMVADKLIHTDHLVQLSLTISIAYLAFFVGENELGVSGVLATLFAALVFGKAAWPLFCNTEGIEHVWHAIEFFGNTILFILCGLEFYQSVKKVEGRDWGFLLLLYVFATLARAAMIGCLYPLLNLVAGSHTAKTGWKECLVMIWGGLRGAVGLALALSMRESLYKLGDERTGDLMVFFVGGIAGLTLCVNASTCGMLLQKLELTKSPTARKHVVQQLTKKLIELGEEHNKHLHKTDMRFSAVPHQSLKATRLSTSSESGPQSADSRYASMLEKEEKRDDTGNSVDVGKVDEDGDGILSKEELVKGLVDSGMNSEELERTVQEAIAGAKRVRAANHWWWGFQPVPCRDSKGAKVEDIGRCGVSSMEIGQGGHANHEELIVERELFLSMLRAEYNQQLESGMLPQHALGAHSLFASVDIATDFVHLGLCDWAILKRAMLGQKQGVLDNLVSTSYQSFCPIETSNGKYDFDLFTLVVFLDTHHIVCERLLDGDLGEPSAVRKTVVMESGMELVHAHKFLVDNSVGVPQIVLVRTKQMAVAVLLHQVKKVKEWFSTGILTQKEADHLTHSVHHAMLHVAHMTDESDEHEGWKVNYDQMKDQLQRLKRQETEEGFIPIAPALNYKPMDTE